MLPTLAIGWQASAVRGDEALHFRQVAAVSLLRAVRVPQQTC